MMINTQILNFILGAFLLYNLPALADSVEPDVNVEEFAKSQSSDVHGFFDLSFKNDYITPRGLLVSNTGFTIQALAGLALDVYQNPSGWLSKASITVGVWNDIWTKQGDPYVGGWNELDWFIGINTLIAKNWLFGVQYLQFVSPPHHFTPENNVEFFLGYDDSSLGWPIVFNPYVKFFWAVSGDSTVIVGRPGNTYDVEIGLIPTLELKDLCVPVILTAPTWITVGPASFWNGGTLGLKNKKYNFGVFSTGLNAKFPLSFIPSRLGNWYFDIGGQYYCLINDNLLQAQVVTLGVPTYKHAKRNIGVAIVGMGFLF
jgi:hypothetical protein